jgi:hypothetical protein
MTQSDKTPRPPTEPAEPVTVFEVRHGGTLRMANFVEAEIRAEFYEHVASFWSLSPEALTEAMDVCRPLAWAVHRIYSDFRDQLLADVAAAKGAGRRDQRRLADLRTRLKTLPEEPEEGAAAWLLSLTSKEFDDRVVPEIEKWFEEPPNWDFEDDYLESGTAQGVALRFFRNMTFDDLETLGVDVVEGDHPGSTYYAAELRGDIDEANRAAIAAGIPVRFVAAKD